MEINEKEDFVEKYDEDSNDDSEDSYDGDDGDYSDDGDDGDNESDDSDDEIEYSHDKKGSSYMNSAFYLLFNLICIMFGWWLGAKGYGKHLIKNAQNASLSK